MTAVALDNLWTYIQSLGLSQSNRKWLADKLIEPDCSTEASHADIHELARIICTDEEYQRLQGEGFLDNPQPQFKTYTDEAIIQRITEGEKKGYVGIERSKRFMESLLRI